MLHWHDEQGLAGRGKTLGKCDALEVEVAGDAGPLYRYIYVSNHSGIRF